MIKLSGATEDPVMQTIPIDAIQPGMVLAMPFVRCGFCLGKGARLTPGMLDRLRNAGVQMLCVR